jgi:hypothetical protein
MPEFGEVAAKLAALADSLPGEDNPFRQTLRQIPALLHGPNASLTTATNEVTRAAYYLAGRGETIDRPETWIFCACMVLIALEKGRLIGGPSPGAGQQQ